MNILNDTDSRKMSVTLLEGSNYGEFVYCEAYYGMIRY